MARLGKAVVVRGGVDWSGATWRGDSRFGKNGGGIVNSGAIVRVDEAARKELQRLRIAKNGEMPTALEVVAAASELRSPLHQYFEWNDTAAAEQYRLFQAGMLIRNVVIRREGRTSVSEPRRVEVKQPVAAPEEVYREAPIPKSGDVVEGLRELRGFVARFHGIPELGDAVDAIRHFLWKQDMERGHQASVAGAKMRCQECGQISTASTCPKCVGLKGSLE